MSVNHTLRAWLRRAFGRTPTRSVGKHGAGRRLVRPRLEELENRLVLSHLLTVTTSNDTHAINPGSGTGLDSRGQISLRSALETADAVGSSASNLFTINVPSGTYNLTLGFLQVGSTADADVVVNGTDLPANIVIKQTDNTDPVFNLNPALNANVQIAIASVEITGGNAQAFGGGGIVGGGAGNSLMLNDVIVTGNASHNGPGGGGIEFDGGNLTLTNCTISNNTAFGGTGGGLNFQPRNIAGSLIINGSTFTGNSATPTISSTAGLGGALCVNGSAGNTYSVTGSTFTGNQASVAGGAVDNAHGTLFFNFNRVVGNSAPSGSGLSNASAADASVDASNTWWGSNLDPSTVSGLISGPATTNPWLVLGASANPTTLTTGSTSAITASFTRNSAGTNLSASNLTALVGVPVTFSATGGGITPAAATIQSTGQATATFFAGGTAGLGTASATVDSATATANLTLNQAVSITTANLSNWTVGLPGYRQTIVASGGSGALTFSAAGPLPNGLTLSSAGVLAGTPTATGSFSFTVTATDTVGTSGSKNYTVAINPAVSIATTTLSTWTAGLAGYSQTISTSGGTGALTFSSAGTLPPGLTLASGGVLAGTPSAAGSYSFTVTATDSVGASASQNYTETINPAVAITTTSLANWTAGLAGYSQTISASGGTGSLTFSATGTPLPGLTLSSSGVLSGTPTSAGSYSFTVIATDTLGATGSRNYTVVINAAVSIATATLANWTVGQAGYSQTISAAGGTGALTFSATGPLPNGLLLSTGGVLSGRPTTTGSFSFGVTATDTVGGSASQNYTVIINPGVSLTTTTLTTWTSGLAGYNQSISASGGTGIKSFSQTGTLPTGLTLSGGGVLSGTPSAAGSFPFTVTATDAVGASAGKNYTVVINPAVSITTAMLANWTAGLAGYNQTIGATGGTGPLTFSVAGTPPAGLALSSTGVLSGTPSPAGSYSFAVIATDSLNATGSQNYTVVINPPVSFTTTSLATWTADLAGYSQVLSASGGTGSLTFSETGPLPTGLTLNSAGVLSGTPTLAGSYLFTATATDSVGAAGSHNYTVVINPSVSIATTTLANWTAGQPGYNQTIRANGGTGTLTFSATGSLPTGLTLSSTGVLAGTPTTAGTYTFSISATDSLGASHSTSDTVTINPAVAFSTFTLPSWTAGQAGYSQTIGANGGTGVLSFNATGPLPTGLTLNSAGLLSGTPTTAGSYNFAMTVTDTVGAGASQNYTVVINPVVSITTGSLANWTAGLSGYSQTIGASGGTGAKTFTQTGALPTGLTLSSAGVLAGAPTTAGSFTFTVTATDTVGASGSQSYTLIINPAPAIATASLANWTAALAGYSQTLTATGGTGSLSFSKTGTLPPGLSLSSGGVLSGAPTAVGSYTFSVIVSDAVGASNSKSYTVAINPAVSITTASLATGTVGQATYSQTINATGGTGPLTFSETGSLPAGLTLSNAGAFSGTPTAAGSYSFQVIAVDTVGASASQNLTLIINSTVSITTASLVPWTAGLFGYSQTINATGGTGSKTFSQAGSLPIGLTLSSAGVLAGTPSAAGNFTFIVIATDSVGASGSKSYTVVINPAVSIATATLANWTAGLAGYSQTIGASDGTGALTFAPTGSLPTGLTLTSAGVLSGTPSTTGSYPFTVTATDSLGATASRNYTIAINPGVTVTTTSLATGTVGQVGYSQTINASGGTGSLTFSVAGTPPAGLTMSSMGVLSGMPTTAGSYSFTVTATDAVGASGSKNYTVLINLAVSITTNTLPSWTAGLAGYSQTISASGGTGTLTFSTADPLPAGLTLSSAGMLSGRPTTAGSYTFTVIATDTVGASGSKNYTVVINPVVSITTVSLANWTAGLAGYSQTISASGGTGSLTFNATGILPSGLTLTGAGVLSGTPSTTGSYPFTVTATDSLGATASQNYTIAINPGVILTTASLATGTVGQVGYSQTIHASGGTGSLTFSVAGTPPAGLTLSSTGVLSGMPTTTGSYSFTVTATDAVGASGSKNYTVLINPAVSITTNTLPNWTAGLAGYNQTISAGGGTGALTFSTTSTLPAGVTLSSAGVLSGTPTTPGSYGFMVTATDTLGATGSHNYTVVINPAVSIATTTLAHWTAGLAGYNQTIGASGGTGPLTFNATGSLPTGLTLTTAGLLSGTPSATGTFSFTVTATDSLGASANQNYTVTINPGVTVTTASLATGTVNQVGYNQTISASGGTGSLTFSVAGTPPAGLTLSSAGVLSGMPTTAGSYSFTITATDAVGATGSKNYTVLINPAVSITTNVLVDWTAGLAGYSQTISASGGTGALTFSTTGTLPVGLTLSNAGVLSGTPLAAGSFTFTVNATDAVGASTSKSYTVAINMAVSITTLTLANWTAGQPGYSQPISASGGTGTRAFAGTGTLPTGLTLSSSGVLAGTPTTAGSFTFFVTATDAIGASAGQSYTVVINPAVAISTPSLVPWTAGLAGYNQMIGASGGTGSLTFSTTGILPAGLILGSGGMLSGTPTAAGSYSFTITATDAVGASGSKNYTVAINPAVSIATSTLPNWTAGLAGYSQTISASGGTGSLTFNASGSLPIGLTVSSGGMLSGTPIISGTYIFTVTATDRLAATGSKNYTVVINPAVSIVTTTLATWTAGLAGYSQTISASGGTGALAFVATSALPTGLTLSSGGVLSGTPTTAGSYPFSVTAFDTIGAADSHGYTVVINPAVTIATLTLANWTAGLAGYSQTISASGGTGSLTFSAAGSLPPGLTLNSAGVLSGTPTMAATYSFTGIATDSLGATNSHNYTVIINPAAAITTATLANWTAGLASYNQTIRASGGTGALVFVATSSLPAGLTLSSSGVLSGTPTTAGSYTFSVTAFDTLGAADSHGYTVVINPAVSIATTSLANWTAGLAGYSQTFSASGGTGSLTFSATGTSPVGLTLSSAGVLFGTPTTAGSYSFTVTASDSLGATGSRGYTVLINPTVSITTASVANWTAGFGGYAQTISASGGTGSVTFSATGSLPAGLTLSSAGILTGTPTTAGSYSFTVTAADSLGAMGSRAYTAVINPAVSIITATLATWTAGLAGYSQTISASGGTGALAFVATSSLPAGLTLSSGGILSGAPTTAGSYTFSVTAFDALGAADSHSYTVVINPAVLIATTSLASWTVGLSGYSQTLSASGGTGPLTFSEAGTLPLGLTLSSGGILSGTPTAAGSYSFTVTATDRVGAVAGRTYTITVNPALSLSPTSLPPATASVAYVQTITVSGGTKPYTTVSVTGFSSGGTGLTAASLTSDSTAGMVTLSGTPTGPGTVTFTVNVADTAGATLSQPFALTVQPLPVTRFLVSAPLVAAANGLFNFTVKAVDGSDKTVSGYNGTVHFISTDTAATLPPDSMLSNGQGTFVATLRTMGNQTITARDVVMPSLTGTSNIIEVSCPSVVVVSPSFTTPGSVTVDGHTVGVDAFATIQQGLDVVCPGGTVYVNTAGYHENLTINKSVTLQGSGSATVTVAGSGSGVGLAITGSSVNVVGLTLENFASGLTAGGGTTTLFLSDLKLTGNMTGGSITGVGLVTFTGNAGDETLTASGTQFGRAGDNLLSYSAVGHLALDGNGGINTLDLSSAPGAVGVTLSGPGSLEGFAGAASLSGLIFTNFSKLVGNGAAGSALTGFNAPATWTVNGAALSQYSSGGQTLAFSNFAVLYGGASSDTFAINGTPASGLTVNGQGGGDSFQVALAALSGPVTLNDIGGSGVNAATLTASNAADTLVVTASAVTDNGSRTVNYAGLENLTVNTGGGADYVAVQGTAAGTPTTISGTGADTFVVTSPAGQISTIAAPLSLNGGAGGDYLYVSEANRAAGDGVYVTDSAIISATGSFAPISYTGTFSRGVILVTGNGNNNVRVFSTAAGAGYGLYTGNGNDTIAVTSPTDTLDSMASPIAVVAGSGTNLLYVSEGGSSTPDTLSLTATGISTAAGFSLSYTAMGGTFGGGLYLVTGSAANTVRVYSTVAGSNNGIELGNGNNNVIISSPTATLDTMAGPIGVQGGTGNNLLYLSEVGSTTPDRLFVSGVSVQSLTTKLFVSYAAAPGGSFGRGVDVVGGSGNNQMYVVGQLAGSPIGVYSGAGNDDVYVYVTDITFYNLFLDGQGGDNRLHFFDLTGTAIVNAVGGPPSGQILFTYLGGLPSTVRYTNLHF